MDSMRDTTTRLNTNMGRTVELDAVHKQGAGEGVIIRLGKVSEKDGERELMQDVCSADVQAQLQ